MKPIVLIAIILAVFVTSGCNSSSNRDHEHEHDHGHGHKHSEHEHEVHEEAAVISDDVAKKSGVKTEIAGPRDIKSVARIRGKIVPSEHKIAHVIPRFSGIVKEGRKHIGDRVEKGEVLAVIESNESLQPFEVRSQISGTVINGHVVVGEFVPENQWIYVVADVSEVWADFFIPLRERFSAKVGAKILISAVNGGQTTESAISYIAPYADEKSQSQLARAVLQNATHQFLPGMFVLGDLVLEEKSVDVAIKKSALQSFENQQSVFVKINGKYQPRAVTLGQSEGEWIQVLDGLGSGEEYVTENSFLIKADILKSGAAHEH